MIIAEIGLNHLGRHFIAEKFITELVETDVDAITLQIREASFHKNPPTLEHIWDTLDYEHYEKFIKLIHEGGKQFGMAVYEKEDIEFFADLGVDFFKVLSMHFMDDRVVELFEATDVPIYLSTGMVSMDDIRGRLEGDLEKYVKEGRLRLIHTQLSHDVADTNLLAIPALQELGVPVAYGNHLENPITVYAALMLNVSDIFFYVHNGHNSSPDFKHAINLWGDVGRFTHAINLIEAAKGDGKKEGMPNKLLEDEEE